MKKYTLINDKKDNNLEIKINKNKIFFNKFNKFISVAIRKKIKVKDIKIKPIQFCEISGKKFDIKLNTNFPSTPELPLSMSQKELLKVK